jgi:hypothetical protein
MSGYASDPVVANAIETAPYEAATASLLEGYVAKQLASGTYDFAANKALLKQYQAAGTAASNLDAVTDVLLLSLMRLPSTDYLALSYLLPGKITDCEKLTLIQKFAEFVEKAQYSNFWAEYAKSSPLVAHAVGFENALRNAIVQNISNTFRDIETSVLAPMLGLDGEALNSFLSSSPVVESVSANAIRFKANEENTAGGGTVTQESSSTRVDTMKRLLFSVRSTV